MWIEGIKVELKNAENETVPGKSDERALGHLRSKN
jgi:hypothetical protein